MDFEKDEPKARTLRSIDLVDTCLLVKCANGFMYLKRFHFSNAIFFVLLYYIK